MQPLRGDVSKHFCSHLLSIVYTRDRVRPHKSESARGRPAECNPRASTWLLADVALTVCGSELRIELGRRQSALTRRTTPHRNAAAPRSGLPSTRRGSPARRRPSTLLAMIHPFDNSSQTRWDRGELKVQLHVVGNPRPVGFCDGTEADMAELRERGESEGADEVRIQKKVLKTGREIWTLG